MTVELSQHQRGTLIRCIKADIYCISFNLATTFLACSSDKGTIHVSSLTGNENNHDCQKQTCGSIKSNTVENSSQSSSDGASGTEIDSSHAHNESIDGTDSSFWRTPYPLIWSCPVVEQRSDPRNTRRQVYLAFFQPW